MPPIQRKVVCEAALTYSDNTAANLLRRFYAEHGGKGGGATRTAAAVTTLAGTTLAGTTVAATATQGAQ